VKTDNRFCNLREVTISQNQHNKRRPPKNNTTGYLGVSRAKKKFVAQICVSGKPSVIGFFDTAEEASEAYLSAKIRLHSGFVP
jgi:hypothetical protein